MARYDNEHKGMTRRRIVDTAGHRLKTDGIDGSGVATLMKDAGLTNGAFYAHFASKDELVATTITAQLHAQQSQLAALTPGLRESNSLLARTCPANIVTIRATVVPPLRCLERSDVAITALAKRIQPGSPR